MKHLKKILGALLLINLLPVIIATIEHFVANGDKNFFHAWATGLAFVAGIAAICSLITLGLKLCDLI